MYIGNETPVAPLAGAWIEIPETSSQKAWGGVAPLAGAWIEIPRWMDIEWCYLVAPLAGAWIEMTQRIPPGM